MTTESLAFTGERFITAESESEITLEHIHRYLMAAELCAGAVVLDAACGAGYGTAILGERAAQAFGVDVDQDAVDYAEQRYGSEGVSFKAASVTGLPFPDNMFDVIVSFETLEHLVEQDQMLAEFRRVLKPRGTLIISTPDKPIYNASLAEPNAFHVSELTREEFVSFVRARFKTAEFYGQRVVFGSLTLAEPRVGGESLRAVRRLPDGFLDRDAYDASMYLIAVCSDGPVKALPVGVYEGAVPQNAMASLLGGLADRDRLAREWRERAEVAAVRVETLERGVMTLERRVEELLVIAAEKVRLEALAEQQSRTLERRVEELLVIAAEKVRLEALAEQQSRYLAQSTQALTDVKALARVAQPSFRAFARSALAGWKTRFSLRRALGDAFYAARRAKLRPRRALRFFHEIQILRSSGLIDETYYAANRTFPPVAGFDEARHYVLAGAKGDPNALFSNAAYLALNPDVENRPITPLGHFVRFGAGEGRPFQPPSGPGLAQPLDPETRERHAWPAAEDREPAGLYDLRPEDDIPREGRIGRAFLDRHGLLGETPDFAGAVTELKAMTPSAPLDSSADAQPRASIVIPVYGQLAYTLNCLHSLFGHGAHTSFEILVGDDASPDQSELYLSQLPHIRYVRHRANAGFVDNCNTTARQARGDYVVFLNNDTRVAPGWLDALIDSFGLFEKAGLIGSKLFYDDGALQEAGGIFWQDGSAWNYGREDDPNRPRYCYARQVDYVSGAAIALPKALWNELGGFDEIFRPAYCEDVDLAFRVRARGLQTWMQPLSRVIHYEGRTSGTDLTQGVKAYQVINARTLFERWRGVLQAHRPSGESPYFERDRSFPKRALIIDAATPTPNEDAGSVTTVTTMRLYQEMGYKVHFVPLHNFLYMRGATDDLHRMGVETAYYPFDKTFEEYLRRYGRFFDVVQVFRCGVAESALELLRRYCPQAPIIFHNIDMHYLRMERHAAMSGDPAAVAAAADMKGRELALINAVDCTIVHSPIEQDILTVETPDASVVVFPYVIPAMGPDAGFADRNDVMFLGGYRHEPNVDAAEFLAREVWPLVRPHLPGVRLLLVGANPPDSLKALESEDIVVTGQVEDLRPYFDRSRVFAAGIRYGAGIKGKVATAMSYGVPVVATTIAAEGMYLVPDRDVRIADDPALFARAVVEFHTDAEAWARFSTAGQVFVAEKNSLEMGRRTLAETIARASDIHAQRTLQRARTLMWEIMAPTG